MADRPHSRAERNFQRDERGISEVLGYVLVFSIVITSVLIVVVGGIATVEDARDAERVENADRAFDVAADNFADIFQRNAPSRSTEIDLGEGNLFYGNNVSITVRGMDSGGEVFETSHELRPIEMHVSDDRSLIYEGGAVFRGEEGGEVMSRSPPFLLDDRIHISVVKTVAPQFESVGRTTVLLRGVATDRELAAEGDVDSVTVEIASPRYEAWAAGLGAEDGVDCTTDAITRTASCTVDGSGMPAYVAKHQIELSLIV